MESHEGWLEEEIAQAIRANPPACTADFSLTPASLPVPPGGMLDLVYQLSCPCGCATAAVLGYPFGAGGDSFLTPLALLCRDCERVTELLDTDLHGYHAEVGKLEGYRGSSKLRGQGERTRFPCPTCSHEWFTVYARFIWWNFDLALDEPELPAQDFFNEFAAYGICERCIQLSQVTDLGKL